MDRPTDRRTDRQTEVSQSVSRCACYCILTRDKNGSAFWNVCMGMNKKSVGGLLLRVAETSGLIRFESCYKTRAAARNTCTDNSKQMNQYVSQLVVCLIVGIKLSHKLTGNPMNPFGQRMQHQVILFVMCSDGSNMSNLKERERKLCV